MAKLTAKQKLFIEEYMIDLNATQAAIRAGYSEKTASRIAIELLNKTHVQEKLQERMAEREKRTEITQDFVLKELFEIAQSNGSDFAKVIEKPSYDEFGNPVLDPRTGKQLKYKTVDMELTDNLPKNKKKAISGIKMGKNGIEVATCDKVKALELLGRHLGMWNDKLQVNNEAEAEKSKKLDNIESILEQMQPAEIVENEKI